MKIANKLRQARGFATSASQISYDKGKDYYKLLGVGPKDDEKKIKHAYYKLAKQYHPDAQNDDKKKEDLFK